MYPAIQQFEQGLLTPRQSLRTLSEARFDRDETSGVLRIERTTLFAEVQCTIGGRPHLLCCPLSALAQRLAETSAQRLKYRRAEFLLSWRLLRDELTYLDATGTRHTCDLILQELPAEGRPLAEFVRTADRTRLLAALDKLQTDLRNEHITHNNLKASNLWVTPDYRLYPLRYAYVRTGEEAEEREADTTRFEALRSFIAENAREQSSDPAQLMCDTASAYHTPLPDFSNHRWIGPMSEQLLCVEDDAGYGYVDTANSYVIEPHFRWANDFREGRAEVETADSRMGLIDKTGRYVIEPIYEIVEYDDRTGRSLVRLDGRWAAFDYEGRQLTDFGAVEP